MTYEGESIYNYLQVKEDEDSVILSTNVLFGVQSIRKKDDSLTGMYYDYALAAPFLAGVNRKENLNVLILGMGTGTFAVQCERYFDTLTIEGVEIDEKITDLAEKYFELPSNVKVTTYDGRAYLAAVDSKYDVIMVDAYQDITIPFQMSSVEFFTMVKEHLTPEGVMVVNMNMRGKKEGNINQYLSDTIASVFEQVYTVDVENSSNRELFGFADETQIDRFKEEIKNIQNRDLYALMKHVSAHMKWYEKGNYMMTDDKAPVELLGMKVIDEMIQEEVKDYKEKFEKEGLKGVLERLN